MAAVRVRVCVCARLVSSGPAFRAVACGCRTVAPVDSSLARDPRFTLVHLFCGSSGAPGPSRRPWLRPCARLDLSPVRARVAVAAVAAVASFRHSRIRFILTFIQHNTYIHTYIHSFIHVTAHFIRLQRVHLPHRIASHRIAVYIMCTTRCRAHPPACPVFHFFFRFFFFHFFITLCSRGRRWTTLPTYLSTCLPTYLPASLLAYSLTCLLAYLRMYRGSSLF